MSIRSFSHLILAALIAVLFGVLATGALADKNDNGKSDPGKRSAKTTQSQDNRSDSRPNESDKSSVDQPRVDRRPPVTPNTGNRGSLGWSDTGSNSTYQRNTPVSPNAGKKSAGISTNARIDINSRDRDYRSRGYTPPTYRGGFYYYSCRPSDRPHHYGYWVFDRTYPAFSRKSVYYHYGAFPYVETARVHIGPYITLSYSRTPVTIERDRYYLNGRRIDGLDRALSDIRYAWLDDRPELIEKYLPAHQWMAVFLDGRYDYSLDPADYIRMTEDAIDEIRTIRFTWEEIRQHTNGDYTAFARHTYRDDYVRTQTVYVSYTLHRIGQEYVIVEVGSSDRAMY